MQTNKLLFRSNEKDGYNTERKKQKQNMYANLKK